MNIVIDAFGGDYAPDCVIEASLKALNDYADISITLAGKENILQGKLSGCTYDQSRLNILAADDIIDMNDIPTEAIRKKKNSSMVAGLKHLNENCSDAFISAGSTGALLAGSVLIVRRIRNIKRSPLVMQLPARNGSVLMLDCGANVDCKPEYLLQFAVMGSAYMELIAGIKSPRVGLVNNGSESHKGNELTKEAYKLLNDADINFIGNVEGNSLLNGDVDVAVVDGFTGNVILKFLEGTASLLFGKIKDGIMSSTLSKFGGLFLRSVFRTIKKDFDYSEYGGALMLGLNKCVIKAHGRSDAKAIYSAIKLARKFVLADFVNEIKSRLENNYNA